MKNMKTQRWTAVLLTPLACVLAVMVEWLAGSACISPQVVKEVQTAAPLSPGQLHASVSGGLTWSVIEAGAVASFPNPSADVNLLIRKGKKENREIQLPLNFSTRLGPGADGGDDFSGWGFLGIHLSTGLLLKRATALSAGDSLGKSYFERPLYKAWVFGPTAGVVLTESYPYAEAQRISDYEFEPGLNPFVSPFVGLYARYIHEKRKNKFIRLRGLLASLNYFPLDIPLAMGKASVLPLGLELFVGAFVGSERASRINNFFIGLGTNRITMPRLVVGFAFGSKGKLI